VQQGVLEPGDIYSREQIDFGHLGLKKGITFRSPRNELSLHAAGDQHGNRAVLQALRNSAQYYHEATSILVSQSKNTHECQTRPELPALKDSPS